MEVLIDTNVFIEREQDSAIPEALQQVERQLKSNNHTICVHPLSKEEVRAYENEEKREIAESKIATYAELPYPEYPRSSHPEFREHVPEARDENEQVDNSLLLAVHLDSVDYLLTEDRGMHEKADRLGVRDRVLSIEEAQNHFSDDNPAYQGPPSIQSVKVQDIDKNDPIFDSLREEYEDFGDWIDDHPDRDAYVNWNVDESLGAVLILKPNEAEEIGDDPVLPPRDRLKISTLKVDPAKRGSKIGELLVSIAIREAIEEGLEEAYLTHRIQDEDNLVQLISDYGFRRASEMSNGESVFVKRLTPGPGDDPDPVQANIRFYPTFYDGPDVDKFLIPIQPKFHSRLFPTYGKRNTKLREWEGEFFSEGNAIKKAYLSHAPTRQIEQGDLLLFYRSQDQKEITSMGVCDRVEYGVTSAEEVEELVGRRSVFTEHEIEERASRPTTVILFKWHFNLKNPLHYKVLRDDDVLSGPPRAIQQIDEDAYHYIRDTGGIDERFIID